MLKFLYKFLNIYDYDEIYQTHLPNYFLEYIRNGSNADKVEKLLYIKHLNFHFNTPRIGQKHKLYLFYKLQTMMNLNPDKVFSDETYLYYLSIDNREGYYPNNEYFLKNIPAHVYQIFYENSPVHIQKNFLKHHHAHINSQPFLLFNNLLDIDQLFKIIVEISESLYVFEEKLKIDVTSRRTLSPYLFSMDLEQLHKLLKNHINTHLHEDPNFRVFHEFLDEIFKVHPNYKSTTELILNSLELAQLKD